MVFVHDDNSSLSKSATRPLCTAVGYGNLVAVSGVWDYLFAAMRGLPTAVRLPPNLPNWLQ